MVRRFQRRSTVGSFFSFAPATHRRAQIAMASLHFTRTLKSCGFKETGMKAMITENSHKLYFIA